MKFNQRRRDDFIKILYTIFLFPLWIFGFIMKYYDLVSSKLFRKRRKARYKKDEDLF